MACAWSLSRFPERFEVEVWESLAQTGGVASTCAIDGGAAQGTAIGKVPVGFYPAECITAGCWQQLPAFPIQTTADGMSPARLPCLPAEIDIAQRPDGSPWELGSGGFGKVSRAGQLGGGGGWRVEVSWAVEGLARWVAAC